MKRLTFAGVALATSILAGCAGTPDNFACPNAGVLGDASELTLFKLGGGTDILDIEIFANMLNAQSGCSTSSGNIYADIEFEMVLERGPAATASVYRVPVFAAVLGPNRSILRKEVVHQYAQFESGSRDVVVSGEIENVLISTREGAVGENYEIIVGLQLTPAQVEYNRDRRAR